MFKRLMALIFALSIAGITGAALAKNSTIPIDGATIGPGEYAQIKFDKLYEGVTYNLTCIIANETHPDKNTQTHVIFHLEPKIGNNVLTIEGYNNPSFDVPEPFTSSGSVFKIRNITSLYKPLSIRNLDYTDTIKVYNCSAELYI